MNTLEAEGKMEIEVSGKRQRERERERERVITRRSKYGGIENGTRHWPRGNTGGGCPLLSEKHEGVFLKVFLRAIADCYFLTTLSFSPLLCLCY